MITNRPPIAKIAIQAPARNLVTTTMMSTVPVQMNPIVLITRERFILRRTAGSVSTRQQPGPVPDHADLAERERHEHTDDVELDQRGDLGPERDDEGDRRERQKQDAVGERQPVTTGVQLAGQVPVLGQNRSQHREPVEGGVGGQHQDQRGDAGDQVQTRAGSRGTPRRRAGRSGSSGGSRAARRPAARAAARPSSRRSPWPA